MPIHLHSLDEARARNKTRAALVDRMAKDLVKYDAFLTEADAIRSLFGRGYKIGEIVVLVDDARQVAMQSVVAKVMGET